MFDPAEICSALLLLLVAVQVKCGAVNLCMSLQDMYMSTHHLDATARPKYGPIYQPDLKSDALPNPEITTFCCSP